jgi:hypothetical protein
MMPARISAADRVRQMAFDALSPAEKTAVVLAVASGAGVRTQQVRA